MSSIYGADFISSLPEVLKNDKTMLAIAAAFTNQFIKLFAEIDKVAIYARIDELPEDVLEIMAYDFKVDWWDNNATLAQKRQLLKDSWNVHRHLGTKGAIQSAASGVFSETKVYEWFEYGGDPFHFQLVVTTELSSELQARLIKMLNMAKNARSVLDGIITAIAGTWNYFNYVEKSTWDDLAGKTWDEISAQE